MYEVFDARGKNRAEEHVQGPFSEADANELAAKLNRFVHENSELSWLCDAKDVRGPFYVRPLLHACWMCGDPDERSPA